MIDAGLSVGIGTDAATCSDALNVFEAMRLACQLSRIHSPDPDTWLTAEDVVGMATRGSARALGFEGIIGSFDAGAKADLVFLDLARIQYLPFNHAVRQVVFQENGSGVRDVMVGGRFVVRAGRVVTVDVERLRSDVERSVERLRAARSETEDLVRRLEPVVGQFCLALAREPYHVHRLIGQESSDLTAPAKMDDTKHAHSTSRPPDSSG